MFTSQDAEADRVFLRDVLGMAHVGAGDGWLIFGIPASEAAGSLVSMSHDTLDRIQRRLHGPGRDDPGEPLWIFRLVGGLVPGRFAEMVEVAGSFASPELASLAW